MNRQSRRLLWLLIALSVAGVFAAFYLTADARLSKAPIASLPTIYWLYFTLAAASVAVFFYVLSRLFYQRSRRDRALLTALLGGFNLLITFCQISKEGWLGGNLLALGSGVAVLLVALLFALEPSPLPPLRFRLLPAMARLCYNVLLAACIKSVRKPALEQD